MMNRTKNSKTLIKTEPLLLHPDPISAFRGAGQDRYASVALFRDRAKERQEEFERDGNTEHIHI